MATARSLKLHTAIANNSRDLTHYFLATLPILLAKLPTRLSTSNSMFFYLESTLLQENVPLHLLTQKCDLQYQTVSSFQPLFPSNGN